MSVLSEFEKLEYIYADCVAYFSGYGGIEVKEIQYGIDDYVIYVSGAWTNNRRVHRVKIQYSDRPYFRFGAKKIYFDELIPARP